MEREELQSIREILMQGGAELSAYLFHAGYNGEAKGTSLGTFLYSRILGRTSQEQQGELERALYAWNRLGIDFVVIYFFDGTELYLYYGAKEQQRQMIDGILRELTGTGESLNKDMATLLPLNKGEFRYGGYIKGDFCRRDEKEVDAALIDQLCDTYEGERFALMFVAHPLSAGVLNDGFYAFTEVLDLTESVLSSQQTVRDERETISFTDRNHRLSEYAKELQNLQEKYREMISRGGFDVSIKYYADKEYVAEAVAGLVTAMYGDREGQCPEPLVSYREGFPTFDDQMINSLRQISLSSEKKLVLPEYSNFLSSDELAVALSMPKRDRKGFFVESQPTFAVGRVGEKGKETVELGKVVLTNTKVSRASYFLDMRKLNRHVLVAGLTGSGKTNSIKYLLGNLAPEIPALIIEPAKAEYHQLRDYPGYDHLIVYRIGDRKKSIHINPFERVSKQILLQTHIDLLLACFKGTFVLYSPMEYVLERAVYRVYEDLGWDIENDRNIFDREVFPTMENLYQVIPSVVAEMGYGGDARLQSDLITALQARIRSMCIGMKGQTLNTKYSTPIEKIMEQRVVVEMENLEDEYAKSFIMACIFTQLYEYRRVQPDKQQDVRHVTLIEEAHRLLKNVGLSEQGEHADPRAYSVEKFCNLLAELRSKGESFFIADQSPSKLSPDCIKNTNLKLAHRLLAEDERMLMGRSMALHPEQTEYLAKLKQGYAIVYSEDDYEAVLVRVGNAENIRLSNTGNATRDIQEDPASSDSENQRYINQSEVSSYCQWCPFFGEPECGEWSYKSWDEDTREEMERIIRGITPENMEEEIIRLLPMIARNGDVGLREIYCVLKMVGEGLFSMEADIYRLSRMVKNLYQEVTEMG